MNRKDGLAPTEIYEAIVRAENTCAAIACETDHEPPCLRGECHPEHCLIVASEAMLMARSDELEHSARQSHEHAPRERKAQAHRLHGTRRLTRSEGELQHSRSSIELTEDRETRSAHYLMRLFHQGSGFHFTRRGGQMRHLGDGCYMAVKKYP